ncbi:MAG: GTPase HflX [Firmicutes bacterium]|uniref:GTPase HflX n=1 Tax=Candidatus Gallilactobacillus intestinavium TaxID=2840838 RepID=A0A9D9H7T8_9LACO|nr:GTPase HflX [Candidatus Gallilactobacillus intestinavium]
MNYTSTKTDPLKAIIVGVHLNQDDHFAYSMKELSNLAKADNIKVMAELDQNLDTFNSKTYLGKGKINEIIDLNKQNNLDLLITNDELTGSQIRNIEKITDLKVLDRTSLILDIFAQRAKSHQAKIQIQIAQLQYQLPRLRNFNDLQKDQQKGIGVNRGSGETQLELNRRNIQKKISHLKEELNNLDKINQTKQTKRNKNNIPSVALVGYTNSGKSTTLNQIIKLFNDSNNQKKVFEKNMLFATLDTSVRRISLNNNNDFILSDTVGFISKLPHNLIEAFKSTLSEAVNADLLIQVVDYSDPNFESMIDITNKVLQSININKKPMIIALNKADLVKETYPATEGNQIIYSAKDEKSIKLLVQTIENNLFKNKVNTTLLIPFDKGNILNFLKENESVNNIKYINTGIKISAKLRPESVNKFKDYIISKK